MSERCQGEGEGDRAAPDPAPVARAARSSGPAGQRADLSIHPAPEPRGRAAIRPSRVGKWRAAVLILVHVLIAVHFVHWWRTGRTLSPFEPSEAMEFSTKGVVNVGFVLFVVAIASTAILGRWFCGWACHIVALQDLCRWLLGKIGLVPRLVALGPLRAVPWLAFVYMFLAPIFDRAMAGLPLSVTEAHFMTEDLWRTFPKTWGESIVTILVCGFVIVWLLGSKGFCAYGCPYGGIFGVVDQVAPARIRVTDACEGCGHCTAVCTSNVNVAREVREHGMVVDAGCMKCLDCVSVCPNDALYVGFGKPAILARTHVATPAKTARPAFDWPRLAVSAAFSFGALTIFLWHDGISNLRFTAITWAFAFAVMFLFRGKSRPRPEHTVVEEAGLAALFLFAMACFRGLNESVSFLFALGIAVIFAWWGVQLVRLLRVPEVRLQKTPLKRAGRWTLAGGVFALTALPLGWLSATGLREQLEERAARSEREHAAHERRQLALVDFNRGVEAAQFGRVDEAIAAFRRALDVDGSFLPARENLAGALCMSGRLAEGVAEFEIAIAQNPHDPSTLALSAQALAGLERLPEAKERLERAIALAPARFDLWRMLGDLQEATGDADGARASRVRAAALERGETPR